MLLTFLAIWKTY